MTGAASGIGKATATRLAREGAAVVLADRTEDLGEAAAAELRAEGLEAVFMACDVTDEPRVEALISQVVASFGRLDVAINNVGAIVADDPRGAVIHETPLAAWQGTIDISLTSTFLCMKHEIAQMLRQGGGVIGNTTSMAGMRVTRFSSFAYAAAKAGVIQISQMAAVLYAEQKIRVNVVSPGLTQTPSVLRMPEAQRDLIVREFHPSGEMVRPQDEAAAFAWACSDDARAVTGLVIPVDGGWAAR